MAKEDDMPEPIVHREVLRPGDTAKPDPFTICFIANPALEAPFEAGQFIADPITGDKAGYDACVEYAVDCIFGDLTGQAERLLDPPDIRHAVRVVSLFVTGLKVEAANSLAGQDSLSDLLIARRDAFRPFLARFGLNADVAFAISASESHRRATAWFTSDDENQGGVAFQLDGQTFQHCFFARVPGTVAMPVGARSLTPLHEFQHALSSYENGKIVDLYVDGKTGLNNKKGRPIPGSFASYDAIGHDSDLVRDGLGYPPSWRSFHCRLHFPSAPAVMDNYPQAAVDLLCENDTITRQFLRDRLRAKIGR
jgi:hypothetical protein